MNDLQKELKNMMIDFDERAKKADINYSIYSGTALGAVRHKGFIPWDDDVDYAINYENRIKLINKFEEFFSDKFELIEEHRNGMCLYMKLNSKTIKIDTGLDDPNGAKFLWLDIFTIGRTKKTKAPLAYKIAAHIKHASRIKNFRKKEPFLVATRFLLRVFFPNFILKKIMFHYLKKKKGDYMYSDYVWNLNTFTNANFDKLVQIEFEGEHFPIFENYNDHLSSYYGSDFMTLPPESERGIHGIKLAASKNDEKETNENNRTD